MRVLEQFEYPLPKLKVDIEKIVIETSMDYEGSFTIRNEGGGTLSGQVSSNSKSIRFSPGEFSENRVNIFYSLDLDMYKPGDILKTEVLISSNGGEILIPVIIKVTNEALITKDGEEIASLKDFANYVKQYPNYAKQLFISSEFTMWLSSIGYEHMDVLDHLISDGNRERALDNFLVLSKLKKRAYVTTAKKNIKLVKNVYDTGIITGTIPLFKTGWGHVESKVEVKNLSAWLRLSTEKITSNLFKDSDNSFITYEIDTAKINEQYVRDEIVFMSDTRTSIFIDVLTRRLLHASLAKTSFVNDESGTILIENNSGKDIILGVSSSENYVKFEAKSYMVGETAKIPFSIKLGALQSAQLAIKKQPVARAEIQIRTIINDKVFKKVLPISIGNIFGKMSF